MRTDGDRRGEAHAIAGSSRQGTPTRRRPWRTFYAVVSSLTLAATALNALGPLQGLASGCSLRLAPIGVRITGRASCTYAMDLIAVAILTLLALAIILGTWRYLRADPLSRLATGLGAAAAVVIAAFPLYTVWWLVDYYRLAVGPMELLMVTVALAVLGVALLAGWRTLQAMRSE